MEDLSVEDVAKELKMHPESVRRLLREQKLQGYQPGGGQWRIERASLAAFKARGGNRRRKYSASTGGHSPNTLRDSFLAWVEDGASSDIVDYEGEPKSLSWVTGQLWDCTDILPRVACDILEIPNGSTFAQAVRKVRAE